MVSQLFPGADPDTSVTHQNFLATFEPNSEQEEEIAENDGISSLCSSGRGLFHE